MDETLKLAMRAVRQDGASMKAAAKQFKVARTTLKRHLASPAVKSSGRPRFFSDSEEQLLHQILRNIQVLQQPFSRPKFVEVARKLAARKGESDRMFGKEWLYKFVRRHPDLVLRPKTWKSEQKIWTVEKCEKYIQVLDYLSKDDSLSDPRGIFAIDSLEVIIPPKEYTKSGNLIPRKPTTEQGYPIFMGGSADGAALRPMVLKAGNLIAENWFAEVNEQVVVGQSDAICLDVDALALYIKRELVPHIQSLNPPVHKSTLFLDGRWSHAYNLEILESCLLNNIQIVCYPFGHAERLQPLDKTELRLIAKMWLDYTAERDFPLNEFIRSEDTDAVRSITAIQQLANIANLLRSGFQEYGIGPFSAARIRLAIPNQQVKPPAKATEEAFLALLENYCLQIGREHGLSEPVLRRALEEYKKALLHSSDEVSFDTPEAHANLLQMDLSMFGPNYLDELEE